MSNITFCGVFVRIFLLMGLHSVKKLLKDAGAGGIVQKAVVLYTSIAAFSIAFAGLMALLCYARMMVCLHYSPLNALP